MNLYREALRKQFDMSRHHAWLHRERLIEYAERVALDDFSSPAWREPVFPEDDREFVEYLGWANTVNFHFTDIATGEKFRTVWPECRVCRQQLALYQRVDDRTYRCSWHDIEAKLWSGSFAMGACFARATRDDGIPLYDASFYRSKEWMYDLARFVFRGVVPVSVIPMLEERYALLCESASCLRDFGDSWMNIFRASDYRAFPYDNWSSGAVEILAEIFPSFRDVQYCDGRDLPFHKRAHLLVQMYEGRARSSKILSRIKDPELLILPADYELPRALRVIPSPEAPALEYSPELLRKILVKEELSEHSREVVEIRLSTVEAGEILQEEINRIRIAAKKPPYSKVEIDYLLWTMGKACTEPHMLVKTTRF